MTTTSVQTMPAANIITNNQADMAVYNTSSNKQTKPHNLHLWQAYVITNDEY